MSDTTLGGVTLHDGASAVISENNCRKESVLTVMPLYLSDSDQTDVFDFGGTIKTINLTGEYIADSIANLKSWLESIEALIQGHQDQQAGYPLTLTDDIRGAVKVKILDFDTTFQEGEPTRITWTLKLVQSSENA